MALVKMKDIQSGRQSSSDPPATDGSSGLVPMSTIISQRTTPKLPEYILPPFDSRNSVLGQQATQFAQQLSQENQGISSPEPLQRLRTDYPGGVLNPVNDLNRLRNTKVGTFVDEMAQAAGRVAGLTPEQMSPEAKTGNKVADTIANVAGSFAGYAVNPAMLEARIGSTFFNNPMFTRAADKAAEKVVPVVGNSLQKVVKSGVRSAALGGLGGAAYAPYQTLTAGGQLGDIPEQVAEQGLAGAAIGGGLGSLGRSVAEAANKTGLTNKAREMFTGLRGNLPRPAETKTQAPLALPEPRLQSRLRAAESRGVNPPGNAPIADPYTFKLNEASPELQAQTNNISEARSSAKDIEAQLRDLDTRYQKAVIEQYKYLKEQRDNRTGILQGQLHRNAVGEVIGRTGRISQNPQWYQEFYRQHNRVPSNKDLMNLAIDHVENGYRDNGVAIPSWTKENAYHETRQALSLVGDELKTSLRGNDLVRLTDSPLKSNELSFRRSNLRPFPTKQSTAVATPAPTTIMGRYFPDGRVNTDVLRKLPLQERLQFQRERETADAGPPMMEAITTEGNSAIVPDREVSPGVFEQRIQDADLAAEPRVSNKISEHLKETEEAARTRLRQKPFADPKYNLPEYAVIGARYIADGTTKYRDFVKRMEGEFGQRIEPILKDIFAQSKLHYKEAERQANGVAHLPGVNSGVDPLKGNTAKIAEFEKSLENSGMWKDKNRFFLNRETAERNFEDVMGKDAAIMNEIYNEPVQKAAAERQRFITKERDDIKKLNIKYKSPEDALVQEYGEGKMSDLKLQAASPHHWREIKKAAETMRSKYDKYLDLANEVLKRNGYKEIPKRKDYFPHYEEIDGLLNKLGFGFEDNTLPSEINGLTSNLKPGKNFFNHALQRKGEETTLGAMAGHDRYIEGISKIIYQTDNIRRLRGLDSYLRETYEGKKHLSDFVAWLTDHTNLLAGKKTEMDRSSESTVGRNLYTAVDWMKRRVGANMIAGSVSSALTNSIPVTQLLATTSKSSVLDGLASALVNLRGNDAIGKKSDFLTRKFTSNKLAMGSMDKAQHVAGSLFKAIDHFTSNLVVRSKYYENIKEKGMSPESALKDADKYASRMMADRSEGSMPTLFHSRTLGLITQFQLEVNNQLSFLFKDMPRSMNKSKYAWAITQILIYDYLYNQVFEKIAGYRPAFDPIGIGVKAWQDFNNPRLTKGDASYNLVKNVANNIPIISTFVGGRIPLTAAFPDVIGLIQGKAKLRDELLKPAKYLALPFGGSQLNKTATGLHAFFQGGVKGNNAEGEYLKFPVEKTPANMLRGGLFGKNSFPEAREFYDNKLPSLTPKETEGLNAAPPGYQRAIYNYLIQNKQLDSISNKAKKIQSDGNMSDVEKQKKLDALIQAYNDALNKFNKAEKAAQ